MFVHAFISSMTCMAFPASLVTGWHPECLHNGTKHNRLKINSLPLFLEPKFRLHLDMPDKKGSQLGSPDMFSAADEQCAPHLARFRPTGPNTSTLSPSTAFESQLWSVDLMWNFFDAILADRLGSRRSGLHTSWLFNKKCMKNTCSLVKSPSPCPWVVCVSWHMLSLNTFGNPPTMEIVSKV